MMEKTNLMNQQQLESLKRKFDLWKFNLTHRGSSIGLYLRIDDVDKNGVVRRGKEKRAHSFVIGFLQSLEYVISHDFGGSQTAVSMIDTSGTSRAIYQTAFQYIFAIKAALGTTTHGIVVGTGNAPSSSDYSLQTLILHGNTANKLMYSASGCGTAGVVGNNVDLLLTRAVSNNSGSSITVKEVGLVCGQTTGSTNYPVLCARDAVDVAIANGAGKLIVYTLRTTV
jgi:hypothetical protein